MRAFKRGGEGYEEARLDAVWNGRTPERYPDAIVKARSEEDVVEAVSAAGERGWKVGVRSGGHAGLGTTCATGVCCSTSQALMRSRSMRRR